LPSLPILLLAAALPLTPRPAPAQARPADPGDAAAPRCGWSEALGRNPSARELRCIHAIEGPGRFGLLSYADVPVYQTVTPLPGTHVVGVPGLPHPAPGESYEAWEWRVLRTEYPAAVRGVKRDLDLLDPFFAGRLMRMEQRLAESGISARRRETWRSPERQAYLFQQGRSRPGPLATTTLTSWHSQVDAHGQPASRAADYDVPSGQLARFHQIAKEVGLESFGADSNDPGHVFLPRTDELPPLEIPLLQLLPRVPVVTLATGRPDDERPSREELARWRELQRDFVSAEFIPFVAPGLAPRTLALLPPVTPPGRSVALAPGAKR
jgi:hypothetical protein